MKNSTLFFLLLWGISISSQETPHDLPKIIPPSPTVANLMQFEEIPVDNYTGQPNITIPLFSKNIHQGLGLNLALSYNTQGVKVDNRSGWTGTGWSLFAGGSVSRTVRGVPDEINDGVRKGVYHNDDFWNYENLTDEQKGEFTWNALGTVYDQYDAELDLYQFSVLGLSGRFVITREGPQLLSNDPNVKIEINQNSTTGEIAGFTIIDTRGYNYHFDVLEQSETIPVSGSIPQGGEGIISGGSTTNITNVTSAWHLSRITTSNDKEVLSLSYQESIERYTTSVYEVYNRIPDPEYKRRIIKDPYNTGVMKPEYTYTSTTVTSTTKKLSVIHFLDGVTVDFLIGGVHPETTGEKLEHLVINNADGTENKRYSFTYEQTDRLWLTKVTEKPLNGVANHHVLSYIDKASLAAFGSKSDPWGYNFTNVYQEATIQKGLLSSIQTPTGGIKEFIWEEHTYSYRGSTKLPETDYVQNPNNTDTQRYTNGFTAVSPFVTTPPVALTTLQLDHPQRVKIRLSGITDFQHEKDYVKVTFSAANDPTQGVSLGLENTSDYIDVPAGNHHVFVQYMGYNLDPNFTQVTGTIQVTYQSKINGPLSEFKLGGGVRIKEILFKDNVTTITPEKRLMYQYTEPNTDIVSSGAVDMYKRGNLENEYRISIPYYFFIDGDFTGAGVDFDVKTKGITSQLTKGGYVGYKNVTISELDKGYTTYTYTTSQDYPSRSGVFVFPFLTPNNLDFKRGLLLKQEVFDQEHKKLQEVEYTNYNFVTSKIMNLYKPTYMEDCRDRQFYETYHAAMAGSAAQKNGPMCGGGPCDVLFVGCANTPPLMFINDMTFTWAQLKESITKDYFYDTSGTTSIVETKTNYDYNTENYQPKTVTQTLTEAGSTDTYVENRYYPVGGYPTAAFSGSEQATIGRLNMLNKVNDPVYTQSHKNDTLLSTVQYIYNEFEPDVVVPQIIKSAKGQADIENRLVYHDYDDYGNPLEVAQEDGAHIMYIWGYDHSKPIAKIANATYIGMPAAVKTKIDALVALSNTEIARAEEQTLRDRFEELRNDAYFKEAQLTSFTYDPLIGVTSQTDAKGYTMYYTYDAFNRLEFIKDADEKLISEYKYHYKNQQ